MITVSDLARSILDGPNSYEIRIQAQSWLNGQLLADDVPVSAGYEETDRSIQVPERVTLTVPKTYNGIDWTPTEADSPLAANGQTLKVSLGIGVGPTGIEWFQRGEFLVQETEENEDGTLTVTCVGLLALVQEANFVAPFQPTGTIVSTLRALVEPAVTVNVDAAPSDRAVPTSAVNWDSDRIGAVYSLMDAWAATAMMNEQGYLEVLPDTVPSVSDAVRAFSDDPSDDGGTVVTSVGDSSRDGGFNVVVATGTASDGTELRAVAYLNTGPWAYGSGTANPLPVPFGYSSPLLTTFPQCQAAAQTVLNRKAREAALQRYTVTAVPDPTLQVGDPVLISGENVTGVLCTVEHIQSLPYFATGPMVLQVVEVG